MVNVFDYLDYRKYLQDYYEEKKRVNPVFSYQVMARKAGFANRGFVYNLVNGKRSLSKQNLIKMVSALQLNKSKAKYFETLVAYSQAESPVEKQELFRTLNGLRGRGKGQSDAQRLRRDQYEYYSTWYHSVIRSLLDMVNFTDNYKWLAKMVNPPITVKKARDSVALLLKLGLAKRRPDGVLCLTKKNVTTGRDVERLAVREFYRTYADLAKRAIDDFPPEERRLAGLTLGISERAYKQICDEMESFRNRIVDIVNADTDSDRVFQFGMHLFPTSERLPSKGNS